MPAHKLSVHFSSVTDKWSTPQTFFDRVNDVYGPFDVDACASKENAKANVFYDESENGLTKPWCYDSGEGSVWMNPPYGRGIGEWVKKAYLESRNGCTVVCLLPARTDTKWFHEYCSRGTVIFLKGRLKFGAAKNSAPFPSMLVIFHRTGVDRLMRTEQAGL